MFDFSGLRLALSALEAQQRSVNVAASTMTSIQQNFNEPSDSGIQAHLAGLATLFGNTAVGADAVYRQAIVQLGVDTQTAANRDQRQQSAT